VSVGGKLKRVDERMDVLRKTSECRGDSVYLFHVPFPIYMGIFPCNHGITSVFRVRSNEIIFSKCNTWTDNDYFTIHMSL